MKKKTAKTLKEKPTRELAELRQRVAELKGLEAKSKQATEAMLWSETKYKILVGCLREGVFITQENPVRLAFANQAAEKITGYSIEELTAFTPEDIERSIHPENRTEFFKLLRDRLAGKPVPEQYKVRGFKKDGSTVWATVSSGRIEYEGEPAALAVVRDITDLKRAEKALQKAYNQQEQLAEERTAELSRENEQLRQKHMELSAILDSAPLIMMLVDQDRQVRQVSNALIQFTGRREEEMLGKRGGEALRCIHHLDDPKGCGYGPICEVCPVRRIVLDTFKTGASYHKVEAKLSFEDDAFEERVLLVSTALLNIFEKMVLVCIEDITERKQAEEALKLSNEELLKEHNQRKVLSKKLIDLLEEDRQQVAMELHDHIGQVLAALKIDIEMTREQFKYLHSGLESRLMVIEVRAARALDDVRDISHGLRPSVLDIMGLEPCLRELFNEIQSRFGIEIHFFQDNIPKRLSSELELALFRIAQEALSNIIKHAQAGKIFVNFTKKDGTVFLSIEDNGIGFEPDQAMESFSRRKPLGLHIMRERAIQLGGEFYIESHKQGGTHLSVEIPL